MKSKCLFYCALVALIWGLCTDAGPLCYFFVVHTASLALCVFLQKREGALLQKGHPAALSDTDDLEDKS